MKNINFEKIEQKAGNFLRAVYDLQEKVENLEKAVNDLKLDKLSDLENIKDLDLSDLNDYEIDALYKIIYKQLYNLYFELLKLIDQVNMANHEIIFNAFYILEDLFIKSKRVK